MNLWLKLRNRARRDASRLLNRRIVPINPKRAIISFTFDDFPRSALHTAGGILKDYGFKGTYYASFGLMGKKGPTGEIFTEQDLPEFIQQGHELGCHTFDHYHSWETRPSEYEASILRNKRALKARLPDLEMVSFSYPLSGPRPSTKRRLQNHYTTARGGGQTYNFGSIDLDFLAAFFIEQSSAKPDFIKRVIDDTVASNGWLILATHDVCNHHTSFGCSPSLFKAIVDHVAASGAQVLNIADARRQLCNGV